MPGNTISMSYPEGDDSHGPDEELPVVGSEPRVTDDGARTELGGEGGEPDVEQHEPDESGPEPERSEPDPDPMHDNQGRGYGVVDEGARRLNRAPGVVTTVNTYRVAPVAQHPRRLGLMTLAAHRNGGRHWRIGA